MSELLDLHLPGSRSIVITAAGISRTEQPTRAHVRAASHRFPPVSDRRHRKRVGVMVTANAHLCLIARHVVDAIALANRVARKVVPSRTGARTPLSVSGNPPRRDICWGHVSQEDPPNRVKYRNERWALDRSDLFRDLGASLLSLVGWKLMTSSALHWREADSRFHPHVLEQQAEER